MLKLSMCDAINANFTRLNVMICHKPYIKQVLLSNHWSSLEYYNHSCSFIRHTCNDHLHAVENS